MELSLFYWIEHDSKTGKASSAKVHRSVAVRKKESVDVPKHWGDYMIDDGELRAIKGLCIEKYVDGVLVERQEGQEGQEGQETLF